MDIALSDMIGKWGSGVAGRGFAQVPNYLLLVNQFLSDDRRLSPVELLILIQLVGAWWNKDELPFPSLKTLAARSGVSDRQAQRAVSRLEEINLIKRVKRKERGMIASNAYDMSPLVRFLGEVSKAFPNEYARKVRKEDIAKVNQFLAGGDPIPLPDNDAQRGEGETKDSPKKRRPLKLVKKSVG